MEALQKKPYTEYLLDILLSGSMEERACVVAEYGKEVRKIEQRISEFIVHNSSFAEHVMIFYGDTRPSL